MTKTDDTTSREVQRPKTLLGPSFANQRSNLSALASSMASFSRTLDVQQRIEKDEQHRAKEAQSFFNLQHDRITRVEENLLKATEDILPMDSRCMTVTELLHLCASLQRANVELMKRLDDRMCRDYAGYESVVTDKWLRSSMMKEETSVAVAPTTPWQPLVGTLLEQVVEADNETDATTTPGSSFFFSPPLSAMSRKDPNTPVTPSLSSLHLSSSTTAVLRDASNQRYESAHEDPFVVTDDTVRPQRNDLDVIEAWRARKCSLSSFKMDQTDDVSSSDPRVNQKPSFDALGRIELPRAIVSQSASLVDEAVHCVQPARSQGEDQIENGEICAAMSNKSHDPIGPLTDFSSLVGEELPQINGVSDSVTIVGDDETYRDDDTAVVTIATVLGRGRERRALQQHQDETYRDDNTAVASTTSFLGRGRQRGVTQQQQDANSESSNEEETTTGTPNKKCNDTDRISTDIMPEKGHKSSDEVKSVRDDKKPEPPTSDMTIVGFDKTYLEDDTITRTEEDIYSPSAHTVKEVVVNTSLSPGSLNCANHAMDISALDMTLASPSRPIIKEGDDETAVESLLVTPVLDRYRLEPDDTRGVRVVPNKRGTHHEFPKVKNQLRKYQVTQTNIHQTGSRPTPKAARSNTLFEISSPFVTQRSRTVYRKTPHPKKAGLFHTIDANASPHLSNRCNPVEQNLAHPDLGTKSSLRSPFCRVSLPELTHRPYYRKSLPSTSPRLSLLEQIPESERRHTISKVQNSMSRTPLTAAWIAKHMPEGSSLYDSFDISRDSLACDF